MKLIEFADLLETTDKQQGFGSMDTYCALGAADVCSEEAFIINNQVSTLTGMTVIHLNDKLRWSFKQIAALIKEKLGDRDDFK